MPVPVAPALAPAADAKGILLTMSFLNALTRKLSGKTGQAGAPKLPPAPGLHHYHHRGDAEEAHFHLRVEPDGSGVLLVNANQLIHLNPTAVCLAFLSLEGVPAEQIIAAMHQHYRLPVEKIKADWQDFSNQFESFLHPGSGVCPVHDLNLDVLQPFSSRPSAPYRMDLALTYRCSNDCAHCYNDRARAGSELTTNQWRVAIDRIWQNGIPHVVFTGGEPTLRPDLPELIQHASQNGQITGLNTNGRRLKDPAFVAALVAAGLDHVQITLESHDPDIHDQMVLRSGAWQETVAGIRNVLQSKLYVMTNTTLLQPNSSPSLLRQTLEFLAELGVPTIGLNALIYSGAGLSVGTGIAEEALPALLDLASGFTRQSGQRLIWYTPTQYCHFDPMALDLGIKGCTAALYNMCVEPDGAVIPCQSYYRSLGNLLTESWDSIWNHPLSKELRERRNIPSACQTCALLPDCGGGCPLARQADQSQPFQPVLPTAF